MAFTLGIVFLPTMSLAQGLPATTLWLAQIGSDGLPRAPERITSQVGYHNQPHFSEDSRSLFYTAEGSNAQTDIWLHDLFDGDQKAINNSPLGDFSPTPIPGDDALSVVRVEADGTQRLWRIGLPDGQEAVLLPGIDPVGYHAWLSRERVALFILGETFDLHIADLRSDKSTKVSESIGRTLRLNHETGELFFVNKAVEPWEIASLDPETNNRRSVLALFPGVEDFELDRQGRLWSGSGSKLYSSKTGNKRWSLAADLSEYGINGITRLAVSPDGRWLAIVSSP